MMTELSEYLCDLEVKPYRLSLRRQLESVPVYLSILRKRFTGNVGHRRKVFFYFYCRDREHSEDLCAYLERNGHVILKSGNSWSEKICIYGYSPSVALDEVNFDSWVRSMNEAAFLYSSEFDGWEMEFKKI